MKTKRIEGDDDALRLQRVAVSKCVASALEDIGIEYEVLRLSVAPVQRGRLFDMGGRRVAFPEGDAYDRCFVVLVDPAREAMWAHPAY